MEIRELLTTYWSQVTFLLIAIGTLIKWILDLKSKKYEINHSLYQENRLSAVNRFFGTYSKAVTLFENIQIYAVFSKEYDANEMDELTLPVLTALDKSLLELMIYFDDSESTEFKRLNSNIKAINKKMLDLYFEHESKMTRGSKADTYFIYKENKFKENEKTLKNIYSIIKKKLK